VRRHALYVLIFAIVGLIVGVGCARKSGPQNSSAAQSSSAAAAPDTLAASQSLEASDSARPPDSPAVPNSAAQRGVNSRPPTAGVELPAGTELEVRLQKSLGSARSSPGEKFEVTLNQPIVAGDRVVLPAGTTIRGHVTIAVPSGRLKRPAKLGLTLDTLQWRGEAYPIATTGISRAAKSHKKRNLALIGGGSGLGALVGGLAGGGAGALIGAGAGAGAGTAGAFATGKKNIFIPAETILSFRLRAPLRMNQS